MHFFYGYAEGVHTNRGRSRWLLMREDKMTGEISRDEGRTEEAAAWKNLSDKILWAISEGNELQAKAAAEEQIRVGMRGILDNEVTEWKYYLIRMMTLLVYRACENGSMYEYFDGFAVAFLRRIDSAGTVEECHRIFKDLLKQRCSAESRNTRAYSSLVQRIMAAVDMDLTAPLTLQYFASKLNVNSSYLSNLFRKETGMTITEYVTGKRMKHAAYLLRSTQEPIKFVAKQVGITDVQYFSRLFKKKMDMTPTQYRSEKRMTEPKE